MVKITRNEQVLIKPDDIVVVTEMNHIVEIQHMDRMNSKAHIKKVDKDSYVLIATGEILEFEHSMNREENKNSLRQTFKKLRYLINNNFTGGENELHVTLTYRENMTDTERLMKDFEHFIKRLRRKVKNSSIDYLSVIEPQERGAWHCHVLMRFNDVSKIYFPNKFDKKTKEPIDAPLYDMWGQGWVTIHNLKEVDNVGAYLSAYLADIEVDDPSAVKAGSEVITKKVDGKEKKFIKGGRLHMYPPGMNIYRRSKGIKDPTRKKMKFKNAQKKVVGSAKPHYQQSIHIEDGDYERNISYLQYNTKRQ